MYYYYNMTANNSSLAQFYSARLSNNILLGIDNEPVNTTVKLGETAEFYCSSLGGVLVWQVDERSINQVQNLTVSFRTTPRADDNIGENSTLMILSSMDANNTEVQCLVLDLVTNSIHYSTVAILYIQGKPLPPSNISVQFYGSKLQLHWNPSFTSISPEPYYVIYANWKNCYSNRSEFCYRRNTNSSLTQTSFEPSDIGYDICDDSIADLFFSVSATLDVVGEGNKSNPVQLIRGDDIEADCYTATTLDPSHTTETTLLNRDDNKVLLQQYVYYFIAAFIISLLCIFSVITGCTIIYYIVKLKKGSSSQTILTVNDAYAATIRTNPNAVYNITWTRMDTSQNNIMQTDIEMLRNKAYEEIHGQKQDPQTEVIYEVVV